MERKVEIFSENMIYCDYFPQVTLFVSAMQQAPLWHQEAGAHGGV